MKNKLMLLGLFTLCSTSPLSAGKLDYSNRDIVDDEMARYTEGTSITKLAKQVQIMESKERDGIDSIDLSANVFSDQGLREIMDKVLPLFPRLEQIDFTYTIITPEALGDVFSLLRRYPNLQYINLWGNGVADAISDFLETGKDQEYIKALIRTKVIAYPKSLVKAGSTPRLPRALSTFPQWRETHKAFYQQQTSNYGVPYEN